MTAPEPTNNPAPITPPSEIIVTWRRLRPLWSPPLSMSPDYPHIAVGHHLHQPSLAGAAGLRRGRLARGVSCIPWSTRPRSTVGTRAGGSCADAPGERGARLPGQAALSSAIFG